MALRGSSLGKIREKQDDFNEEQRENLAKRVGVGVRVNK